MALLRACPGLRQAPCHITAPSSRLARSHSSRVVCDPTTHQKSNLHAALKRAIQHATTLAAAQSCTKQARICSQAHNKNTSTQSIPLPAPAACRRTRLLQKLWRDGPKSRRAVRIYPSTTSIETTWSPGNVSHIRPVGSLISRASKEIFAAAWHSPGETPNKHHPSRAATAPYPWATGSKAWHQTSKEIGGVDRPLLQVQNSLWSLSASTWPPSLTACASRRL